MYKNSSHKDLRQLDIKIYHNNKKNNRTVIFKKKQNHDIHQKYIHLNTSKVKNGLGGVGAEVKKSLLNRTSTFLRLFISSE